MTAKSRILELLSGPVASRIRFSFPLGGTDITISSHTFQRVARAIRHDHIAVNVTTVLPPGVAAQYHDDTDTLDTQPVIGRVDEGLVLHESTHAFFDITRQPIDALHEEAAAYVVDALYFRMTGLTRPRWNGPPHAAAGNVADALLQEYQRGATPVPSVNATAWANLMSGIRSHLVYRTGPAGTGGSYVHDGVR